jgi:hypothetical protein
MNSLFEVRTSPFQGSFEQAPSLIVQLVSRKQNYEVVSTPKIVSPTLTYDKEGEIKFFLPQDIINSSLQHNYFAGSKEYSQERIADILYSRVQKALEHYPSIPQLPGKNGPVHHALALMCYYDLVYLKPTPDFEPVLNRLDFITQGTVKARTLEIANFNLKKHFNVELDLYSVPKKGIGEFANFTYKDGYSRIAYSLGFGQHKAMPRDRIAREASSLKAAEIFTNPTVPKSSKLPASCNPFTTVLRVALVMTETSMLDSGDLYPSGVKKSYAKLRRKVQYKDLKEAINLFGKENLNLVKVPSRAGIDLVHEVDQTIDETKIFPGTIRFVMPNGIKINAQPQYDKQAYCENEPVDLLMDFRSVAAKGAASLLLLEDPDFIGKELSFEEAFAIVKTKPRKKIKLGVEVYEGYVIDVPVFRPGQRYTDFSKPSDNVTSDMITKAIMKEKFIVPSKLEKDYAQLRTFAQTLHKEILA